MVIDLSKLSPELRSKVQSQMGVKTAEAILKELAEAGDREAQEALNGAQNWGRFDGFESQYKAPQNKKNLAETKEKPKSKTTENLLKVGGAMAFCTGAGAVIGGLVGALAGGAGAIPGAVAGAKAGAAVGVLLGLSSCGAYTEDVIVNEGDVHAETKVEVEVKISLINQIKLQQADNYEDLMKIIQDMYKEQQAQGVTQQMILDAVLAQGLVQMDILAQLEQNNQLSNDILNEVRAIKGLVVNMGATINNIDKNITVAGKNLKAEFEKLYNAINNGNKTLADIRAMLNDLKPLLQEIVKNQDLQIELQEGTNLTLNEIVELLGKQDVKLEDIINILNAIKSISQDTNDTVHTIADEIKDLKTTIANEFGSLRAQFNVALNKLDTVIDNQEKEKELLDLIYKAIGKLGKDIGNKFLTLINTINGDSKKLDDIIALLRVINSNVLAGNELTKTYGKQILDAINKGNLKLDELLKYVKHIDEDLHEYGEKGIKLGNAILEAINKIKIPEGKEIDMTAVLAKLDEILAAIKDHDVNVTVDITGKVTCECNCNCGGNHEGIQGELVDINTLIHEV